MSSSSSSSIQYETATLNCADIDLGAAGLVEGECIETETFFSPLAPPTKMKEQFFPKNSIYIRKEMCEVFQELTKMDRKLRQVLIGSPGVGKSVLIFLVALYRALYEEKPVCFIRKTRDVGEFTSVFFMRKKDKSDKENKEITIRYSRILQGNLGVDDVLADVLQKHMAINRSDAQVHVMSNNVLLFIDGLHEGDQDLYLPHHYLATSGGHDVPQGESATSSALVVLSGWEKTDLQKALELTSDILDNHEPSGIDDVAAAAPAVDGVARAASPAPAAATTKCDDEMEGLEEADADGDDGDKSASSYSPDEVFEDIFYHTGGRIREALKYAQNPDIWKADTTATVNAISKNQAMLSIVDTKGSGDKKSPDRVRTMFRIPVVTSSWTYFGSAYQVVDSQFVARLLRDRVGLENYYNAYMESKEKGLASAAGCHFEELLHQLFYKRPSPISGILQSKGTGVEGVNQLSDFLVYWIPSVPNFANIDAALLTKDPNDNVTVWCFQYTISAEHTFNPRTFRTKFLRPLLQTFKLQSDCVSVKIAFVVPDDVHLSFRRPEEVDEEGYEGLTVAVDCSSVETVKDFFDHEELGCIDNPVRFFDDPERVTKALRRS